MLIPLGGLVSLLGAFYVWPFLYKVVLRKHRWPQKSAVHATEHPRFTDQSLLGCASLERAAQGGWQGKGAGTGVTVGGCVVVALLQAAARGRCLQGLWHGCSWEAERGSITLFSSLSLQERRCTSHESHMTFQNVYVDRRPS